MNDINDPALAPATDGGAAVEVESAPIDEPIVQLIDDLVAAPPLTSRINTMKRLREMLGEGNYRRIARKTKHSSQHISRIMRGLGGTSFDTACQIADAAGVTLDELRAYLKAVKPGPRDKRSHKAKAKEQQPPTTAVA